MVQATSTSPTASFSTTSTVSSPLDLDSFVRGEHEAVKLNGSRSTAGRKTRPKVTLTSLTVNNSGTLRKLNSVVIPIVYSERFYKEVLDPSLDEINKLVYYGDIPVGAICCKFETPSKDKPATLVILTLAVLAPYRSQSLGAALLRSALHASLHPTPPPAPLPSADKTNTRSQLTSAPPRKPVTRASAHVQVGNEEAKRFYERLGFKKTDTVHDYYSKMEPRDAVLMVCEDIGAALGEGANGHA